MFFVILKTQEKLSFRSEEENKSWSSYFTVGCLVTAGALLYLRKWCNSFVYRELTENQSSLMYYEPVMLSY